MQGFLESAKMCTAISSGIIAAIQPAHSFWRVPRKRPRSDASLQTDDAHLAPEFDQVRGERLRREPVRAALRRAHVLQHGHAARHRLRLLVRLPPRLAHLQTQRACLSVFLFLCVCMREIEYVRTLLVPPISLSE